MTSFDIVKIDKNVLTSNGNSVERFILVKFDYAGLVLSWSKFLLLSRNKAKFESCQN